MDYGIDSCEENHEHNVGISRATRCGLILALQSSRQVRRGEVVNDDQLKLISVRLISIPNPRSFSSSRGPERASENDMSAYENAAHC